MLGISLTCALVALIEDTSEQFITLVTCSRFIKGMHYELVPVICGTRWLSIIPEITIVPCCKLLQKYLWFLSTVIQLLQAFNVYIEYSEIDAFVLNSR